MTYDAQASKFGDGNDIAGAVVVTRKEIEEAEDRGRLLDNKLSNMRWAIIKEIERQWGIVIEYAENTTGAADNPSRR